MFGLVLCLCVLWMISIIVKQRLSAVAGGVGIVCSVLLTGHRGGRLVWYCVLYKPGTGEFGLVLCIVYCTNRAEGWLVGLVS